MSEKLKFIKINYELNAKIDRITKSCIPIKNANMKEKLLYYSEKYIFLRHAKNLYRKINTY